MGSRQVLHDLAQFRLVKTGGRTDAKVSADQQIWLLSDLVRQLPDEPEFRRRLADAHTEQARLLIDMGRLDRALEHVQESLACCAKLVDDTSQPQSVRSSMADAMQTAALIHLLRYRFDEAQHDLSEARKLHAERLSDISPQIELTLSRIEQAQGRLLAQTARPREGLRSLQTAVAS